MCKWNWKWLFSLLALFITTSTIFSSDVFAAKKVVVLELNGPIGPAAQDYIKRGIATAENEQASAIILQLNTPGGLESSMRSVNEAILSSSIPVMSYVYPSGAHAASAGLFILYASHFAAMAPGTNIGAASPIRLMGNEKPSDANSMSTEEKKAVNDAAAYIRSLAQLRGRNADWAEKAVREAVSISANEAKKLNVIDAIAENNSDLLEKANTHTTLIKGTTKNIDLKPVADVQLTTFSQDWRYRFLSFITNPNIAYILLLIAVYGIFFELSNPGLVLPGVAGTIALLLALYAFQLMPINYVGLLLVLMGMGGMVLEIVLSTFGIVGFGGVIAFIIGSIMLFDTYEMNYRLHGSIIVIMSVLTIAFFFMVLNLIVRSHKVKVVTGEEGIIGCEGEVLSVNNNHVIVRVLGEIWRAKSKHSLQAEDKIKVTDIRGLILIVEPLNKSQQNGPGK